VRVSGVIAESRSFSGRGIIQLGPSPLVAMPVERAIFSGATLALELDRTHIIFTLIVPTTLSHSLLGRAL
jgi:hypothetical protein